MLRKHVRSEAPHSVDVPAHSARLCIFQPTRRPSRNLSEEWVVTKWGKMKISAGWLGQEHADVIDACFATALQVFREPDGRIQLLVDPYMIRTILVRYRKSERIGGTRLRQIMQQVTEVRISWEGNRTGVRGTDSKIIERRTDSTVMAANRVTGKSRPLWRVTISSAWANSMTEDIL